jgi:hypothetical protein
MLPALSGCATVGFESPAWDSNWSLNNRQNVEEYLNRSIDKFDEMVRNEDTGKYLLEVPIILAAIMSPAAIALGGSTDWAIAGAAVAAGGSAGSAYQQPRLRISHTVQARRAIGCVRREYATHIGTASAWNFVRVGSNGDVSITSDGLALTGVSNQLTDAGRYAANTADDIVGNLKSRLGDLGQAPNFDNIVTQLRTSYDTASAAGDMAMANLAAVKGAALVNSAARDAAIQEIAAYSTRLRECAAAMST